MLSLCTNYLKSNFDGGKFLKIRSTIPLPGVTRGYTKNLGPIGSAVLTFIGYKQTDKQTNRQTNKQADKPNLYTEVVLSYFKNQTLF